MRHFEGRRHAFVSVLCVCFRVRRRLRRRRTPSDNPMRASTLYPESAEHTRKVNAELSVFPSFHVGLNK